MLRESVAEQGRERLAVTLAKVVVTGTTRSALRLSAQPLKPLSCIAPNPNTTLFTPDALKAEIDTQAAMNVHHRHLVLDDDWPHAHTDTQCWERFFNSVLDLPVWVLLQFLRLGLQPLVPEERTAYCNRSSADPVLSDHLMQPSISRPGSWATAADNIPRWLLQPGGFGLSLGMLTSRRQAWLGMPSLPTMPVQYGIYKGKTPNDKKKPPNLMTSYWPVVAESPVTGAEAHTAKSKLDHTLEASALYPTDYFTYRDELRAAELAVVSHAACSTSLEVYGSVARCGRDESDAYLRKQRDHVQPLCSRLSPAWNYGEWAAGFYSQLCIRVVSADGFTPGSLLKGWDGQASFLADATTSMHCGFTKAPPPASILNHLFRQLVSATVGAQELWVRAQHDTGHTHTVALLQRDAHLLAAQGAPQALTFTAPLLPL